jgi:hypothetical protein
MFAFDLFCRFQPDIGDFMTSASWEYAITAAPGELSFFRTALCV